MGRKPAANSSPCDERGEGSMKEILRRTWAEIDLDALASNFRAVLECSGPGAQVWFVI